MNANFPISSTTSKQLYFFLSFILLMIATYPLSIDTVPPLLDYPIHLARSYITIQYPHDNLLRDIFAIDWRPIPNLASDIVLMLLGQFIYIETAGRILIFICIIITVLGIGFLHRVNFGRWSLWPLLAVIPAYHGALTAGFINYSIGVALIPWFLGFSKVLGRCHLGYQILGNSFASMILFFCHVISVGLFGVFLLGQTLWEYFTSRIEDKSTMIFRLINLSFPFVLPAILYINHSLSKVLDRESPSIIGMWDFDTKFRGIMMPFLAGNYLLDVLSLLVFLSMFFFFYVKKKLIFDYGLLSGIAMVVALFIILPGKMLDASFIADRLPVSIALMIIASTDIRPINVRLTAIFAALVLALAVGRAASMATSWKESSEYYGRLDNIAGMMEKGSAVMILSPMTELRDKGFRFWHDVRITSPHWHFALLNVPTLHAFSVIPLTKRAVFSQLHFVWADKQILSLTEPYRDLDFGDGGESTWDPEIIFEQNSSGSAAMSDVVKRFDYALVVYADRLTPRLRDQLENQSPLYADKELMLLRLPVSAAR